MKRLVGQIVLGLAVLGMLAVANPARADEQQECDPCKYVLWDLKCAKDDIISAVMSRYNKCSVDASVLYLGAAIDALKRDDEDTALRLIQAAHMCLCRESRELDCTGNPPWPTTCVPYDTIPKTCEKENPELAVAHHTVDAQQAFLDICEKLEKIIDCLD
jgi:hypothetical protein